MSKDDKTTVIGGNQATLVRELERAKDQPPCLIMIRGTPQGQRFFIEKDELLLGRDPTCDVALADHMISKKHLKIIREGEVIKIEDLGSTNGTQLNGKNLSPGNVHKLAKEDMIKVGSTILKYLPAGELETVLYGNLNAAATLDALTQCFNKGYFLDAIAAEVKRSSALATDLTLVFFDLDHFKKTNDTFGHEAGDFVLKEFAKLVRSLGLDQKSIFARYGGEEFCILLPSMPLDSAAKLAENIRGKVQLHEFIFEGKKIPVTTSLGVAAYSDNMESAQDLIKAADQALYKSKHEGRNRVTVARG